MLPTPIIDGYAVHYIKEGVTAPCYGHKLTLEQYGVGGSTTHLVVACPEHKAVWCRRVTGTMQGLEPEWMGYAIAKAEAHKQTPD